MNHNSISCTIRKKNQQTLREKLAKKTLCLCTMFSNVISPDFLNDYLPSPLINIKQKNKNKIYNFEEINNNNNNN